MNLADFTVRASSLSSYADCPRRWLARQHATLAEEAGYRLRKIGRHIGAATGQATHQGALSGLRRRIATGSFDGEEMEDIAIRTLRDETTEEVIWDDRSPNLSVAERQVVRQIAVCRDQIVPVIDAEFVEPSWKGKHSSGLILSGHPDCVSYTKIGDIKTGLESNNGAQYGGYVLLSRVADELVQIEEIEESFVPRVKLTEPVLDVVPIAYDLEGCADLADRTLNKIANNLRDFYKDGPAVFLANTSSMLCSDKFCPAWGTRFCPESTLSKRG